MSRTARRVAVSGAMAVGAVIATAGPALAYNDNYNLPTGNTGECEPGVMTQGYLDYVDYGEGAEGGGNNDDYFVVKDVCADGHGVKAWAWQNGTYLGDRYVGTGAGTHSIWDPFINGNVSTGDKIGMKICVVDGNNGDPWACNEVEITSHDG